MADNRSSGHQKVEEQENNKEQTEGKSHFGSKALWDIIEGMNHFTSEAHRDIIGDGKSEQKSQEAGDIDERTADNEFEMWTNPLYNLSGVLNAMKE